MYNLIVVKVSVCFTQVRSLVDKAQVSNAFTYIHVHIGMTLPDLMPQSFPVWVDVNPYLVDFFSPRNNAPKKLYVAITFTILKGTEKN